MEILSLWFPNFNHLSYFFGWGPALVRQAYTFTTGLKTILSCFVTWNMRLEVASNFRLLLAVIPKVCGSNHTLFRSGFNKEEMTMDSIRSKELRNSKGKVVLIWEIQTHCLEMTYFGHGGNKNSDFWFLGPSKGRYGQETSNVLKLCCTLI